MGGSKKPKMNVTLYHMGIHMGLARSMDELVQIEVGGKDAWKGSATNNGAFSINKPDLFGGETKEGGIQGSANLLMGRPDQQALPALQQMLGGLVPAFRGIASFFYNGLLCANSPYPKQWKFRVRRTASGWNDDAVWYSTKATIWLANNQIKAMNPAHILYQLWTGQDFRGLSPIRLDDTAWRQLADLFYSEELGLCFKWTTQSPLKDFMQQVMDHVGMSQYVNRYSGLIIPMAIRGGYDANALPLFTPETGLLGIDEYATDSLNTGINEVVVNYCDPLDRGNKRQIREKNIGAIHASGGTVNSTEVDYIGAPTGQLARRLARRDLNALAGFLRRFNVRLDRRAAAYVVPGGLIRISEPALGIENMVVRIGQIDFGSFEDGQITVKGATDVFGLPATVYNTEEESGYYPPDATPVAIGESRLMEAPYRDLVLSLGNTEAATLSGSAAYLAAMAMRPSALTMNYWLHTKVTGSADYHDRGRGLFCGTATLAAGISYLDNKIVLANAQDLLTLEKGVAALIDDEIVRIDAYDSLTQTVTIGRGCADTVPAKHIAGARIWFYEGSVTYDDTEYSAGVRLDVKLQPITTQAEMNLASVTARQLTFTGRPSKPYPPGQFKINNQYYPTGVTGGVLNITWTHRNRITQAELLVDTVASSHTPEDGTSYTVRLRSVTNNAIIAQEKNITGTKATLISAYDGNVLVELLSVRDNLESYQKHSHVLNLEGIDIPGWDFSCVGTGLIISGDLQSVKPDGTNSGSALGNKSINNPVKKYFEVRLEGYPGSGSRVGVGLGIESSDLSSWLGRSSYDLAYYNNGDVYHGSGVIKSIAPFDAGDILMFAINHNSSTEQIDIWLGVNGVWSSDPLSSLPDASMPTGAYRIGAGFDSAPSTAELTMVKELVYPLPAGYLAWNED